MSRREPLILIEDILSVMKISNTIQPICKYMRIDLELHAT